MTFDEYADAWIHQVTRKQLALIQDMQEFSDYPLPPFTGSTKKEASEYINTWMPIATQRTDKFGFY